MMKIHTTQNLNSLVQLNQLSTSNVSSKDFRLKNYSEQMLMPKLSAEGAEFYSSSISFGKKKPSVKDAKKIIETSKKMVGENMKKEANLTKTRGDKFITGSLFDTLLKVSKYETGVQAAIAAIICTVLRPATIMAIPTKKSKQDNTYASAHSMASGFVGFFATLLLTTPFKWGADHVTKVMLKDLKKEALERLYPQLNIESIVDKAGKRVDVDSWLNRDGKPFCKELKDVMKLPQFIHLGDASKQTFEKVLKIKDVDWDAQKGKSFNDVVLKNGEKLYDKIDMSRLGIIIKEEGMSDAQVLLRDIDEQYLANIIKDAPKDSNWSKLDIKSVYDSDKNIVDFRKWKDISGKEWKLDLDAAYVSSPYETASYKPRITGHKRFDEKDKEYKFTTYQKNGDEVTGSLGTAINEKMVASEARNEGHMKLLTWFPDLAFRIPIAATTIALIPWILKNVFHVEKSNKKASENQPQIQPQKQQIMKSESPENTSEKEITFKAGKDDPKKTSWFIRKFGEIYGKPLLENEKIAKASEYMSKWPGTMTTHMATLGSFITSSVYVQRTMTNKDLDDDRRRTLAINQALCFFIPTVAAYTVDHFIKDWTKKQEYRYSGWQEHKTDIAKFEGKVINNKDVQKELGNKLKGVRILASLATFTLIYRYATPVIITPIANWIGDKINAKKTVNAKEISLNSGNQTKTMEIGLAKDKQTNIKQVA